MLNLLYHQTDKTSRMTKICTEINGMYKQQVKLLVKFGSI